MKNKPCRHRWAFRRVGYASIVYCVKCRRWLTGEELVQTLNWLMQRYAR